jgi:hypothetical protein
LEKVIDIMGFSRAKERTWQYSTLEVGGDDNLLQSYAYLKSLGAE